MTEDEAMALAIAEAAAAGDAGDVPVGAVVLIDSEPVAVARNERELRRDPTAHAEVLALRAAAEVVGDWRLGRDATLVVSLEPCAMCAGAALSARVGRVVFATADPKGGACGSLYNLGADPRLNHEFEIVGGVRAAEASRLLSEFFTAERD